MAVLVVTARTAMTFFMILVASIWLFSSLELFPSQGAMESALLSVPRLHTPVYPNSTSVTLAAQFPKIIHTMWKSPDIPPPAETVRWKKGCRAVNPDHEYRLYYDSDLLEFVKKSYPEYLALFESLKGVYMADMARVLVIYHYGGIYMDLDFYCHRPFTCITDRLLPQSKAVREEKDILIVSLEPSIHANIFRDKDRVVIQDFYMATARHPFFKWFLDQRLEKFKADPLHPAKGPFSYSIEVDIDAYKKSIIDSAAAATLSGLNAPNRSLTSGGRAGRPVEASGAYSIVDSSDSTGAAESTPSMSAYSEGRKLPQSISASTTGGYIHELREDVLHPLVDSTNPRLNSVCAGGKGGSGGVPVWAIKSCEKVRSKSYFSPSEFTIAVHMWTHTFLGWSFFRGLYNSGVYAQVERALSPSLQCPRMFYEETR